MKYEIPIHANNKMIYVFLLAKEREIAIKEDNINDAVKKANEQKTDEERIVSIRLNRVIKI